MRFVCFLIFKSPLLFYIKITYFIYKQTLEMQGCRDADEWNKHIRPKKHAEMLRRLGCEGPHGADGSDRVGLHNRCEDEGIDN